MQVTTMHIPNSGGTAAVAEATEFDEFYRREYPALVRLAWAVSGRQVVAEELTQEAMVKVLGCWSTVSQLDKPGAYARRVVLNLAISAGRRRAAEFRAFVRRGTDDSVTIDPEVGEFWTLVRGLAPRQAQVVALYYVDQYSTVEIAEVLELSEGSVRATLSNARARLREQLEGQES